MKPAKHHILALLAATALAGCAIFPKPSTPQQGVYEVGDAYAAALKVAVAYENLPTCGSGVALCSSPAVLAKVRAADAAAYGAWKTAENLAAKGVNDQSALSDANAAVRAFVALTASLKVH